jgi:hypothetical protein
MFRAVYCVGSRWTNVHWGANNKTKGEYIPPPPPEGFERLRGEKERVSGGVLNVQFKICYL